MLLICAFYYLKDHNKLEIEWRYWLYWKKIYMLIYSRKLRVINAHLTTPTFWFTFLCTNNIGFCTLLLSTSMNSSMESEFKMQILWNIQHATTIFNAVSTSAVTKYCSLLNLPFKRPKDLSIVTLFSDSKRL